MEEEVDKVRIFSTSLLLLHGTDVSTTTQISEHIERLVTLIKSDEPAHNIDADPDLEEFGSLTIDDQGAVGTKTNIVEVASDDEDNVIEEV
jgi:hypothetical protein